MTSARRHRKPLVIGITGGIATGKSEVLKVFRELGFQTVSADDLAHLALKRGKTAYGKILKRMGRKILNSQREIDRKALGNIVFSSPQVRRWLERIIHPEVVKALAVKRSVNRALLAMDIPLLFEARLEKLVDRIVVVYSMPKEQLNRLVRFRGMSKSEAIRRIKAQWPIGKKCLRADFVIDNSTSLDHLRKRTRLLLKGWLREQVLK